MDKSDLFKLPQPTDFGKTNMNPLQSPFLSLLNNNADSKEYLVQGAKLMCVHGAEITELLIPESHNYTSGGKVKANCKDCKACENIPYFGACSKNVKDHLCEGFMELEEKWENTEIFDSEPEKVNGEDAISLTSILLCKKEALLFR